MATPALSTFQAYEFVGGFPTADTVARAYDDADLVRAITAYRFFYPSVSALCVYNGNIDSGMVANRVFCVVRDAVGMSGFTMNSDTPYVGLSLDLTAGSIVIERSVRSPPMITLTMPPPALASTVSSFSFSCACSICSCICWACFIRAFTSKPPGPPRAT